MRPTSDSGGSQGWWGSGKLIQQNQSSSASRRVQPGDGAVGHPVGVVDPPVDRVDLDLGGAGVPAPGRVDLQRPVEGRVEAAHRLGVLGDQPPGVVEGPDGRRGWPARGARSHGGDPRAARCRCGPGRSPRSGGRGRGRARSGPCPPGRCGSPAACSTSATEGASSGSGTPFIHTPWVLGCWPVRMVERDGMHTTDWGWARSNRIPSAARPSTTGVRARVPPLQPSVS